MEVQKRKENVEKELEDKSTAVISKMVVLLENDDKRSKIDEIRKQREEKRREEMHQLRMDTLRAKRAKYSQ